MIDPIYSAELQGATLPQTQKYKILAVSLLIIAALGSLAVGGVGLGNALHTGSLSQQALIMMVSGGGGALLFLIPGIVIAVKNRTATSTTATGGENALPVKMFVGADQLKSFDETLVPHPAPPIPKDLKTLLESYSPFFPGQTVGATSILILVPKGFNPQRYGKRSDLSTRWATPARLGICPYSKQTHWALLTREIVPESLKLSANGQRELAKSKGYELADAHEVGLSMMVAYGLTGQKLYNSDFERDPIIQAEDPQKDYDLVRRYGWYDTKSVTTLEDTAFSSSPPKHFVGSFEEPSPKIGAAFVKRFF